MGPAGTTGSVSFSVPATANLGGQPQLLLQMHGLKYQTEASVRVNSGSWLPINSSTISLQGLAATYGGIGGGFATLTFTMNLPAGSITTGNNTLTFQFLGTDGTTSGFRVLSLNVLDASGNQLIPASTFVQENPANWTPPLTDAADIQAGETLWKSGPLNSPSFGPIRAHCADCHTTSGMDLKYFNYSNYSIEARSGFHGLTALEGQQIASYIRSLNTPAPSTAAPWNPPYQPGPGLDSQPAENWAAGAGLSALVDTDSDMAQYMLPGGSTASLAAGGYLNQRELPIKEQLLDWNRWLPTIHPLDAWGSTFTNSSLNQLYLSTTAGLVPNSAAAYLAVSQPLAFWAARVLALDQVVTQDANWNDPTTVQKVYSIGLWSAVKSFELNQTFGLEAMPQVVFGARAELRAWYSQAPFVASPLMLHLPVGPGLGNGTAVAYNYLDHAWDQAQLILNDGNGMFQQSSPIDFPYAYAAVDGIGSYATPVEGQGALIVEWLTKALQQSQYAGPPVNASGWNFLANDPSMLVIYPNSPALWTGAGAVSATQRVALINNYLTQWLSKVTSFTPAQIAAGGWVTPVHSVLNPNGSFLGDKIAYMIPQFLYWGVDPNIVNQIAAWARTIWPSYNWAGAVSATCGPGNAGIVCSNRN
jgi:hypothetical protein